MEDLKRRKEKLTAAGLLPFFFWECQIERKIQKDPEMRLIMNEYPAIGPLLPRDAFQGFIFKILKFNLNIPVVVLVRYV